MTPNHVLTRIAFIAAFSMLSVACGGGGSGESTGCEPACTDGFHCLDGSCVNAFPCIPDCQGKQRGDDGCGAACGTCPTGDSCNPLGQCVNTCVPDCHGKECGADGCGGSCGDCGTGTACNAFGACEALCTADCKGKECGDDGCNGSCGVCGQGEKCESGKCVACTPDCVSKECGDNGCGGSCGDCGQDEKCEAGKCVACTPDCVDKECGDNGCGGLCGKCSDDKTCDSFGKCIDICHPDCAGKECGDDGCGGVCADCVQGYYCSDKFECVQGCQPQCEGKDCGDDGCEGSCGECGAGAKCEAGKCVACQSQCAGKDCGDDGCGGSCGSCGSGQACNPQGVCIDWDPCPVAAAISCGESVFGDNTGKVAYLNDYDCSTYDESGPEVIYSFTGQLAQTVTVSFDGLPDEDLDIFVLDASCETTSCIGYGDSSVVFDAAASVTYMVVIDGYELAESEFFLDIACCSKDCAGKACDADDGCGGVCGCTTAGQACVDGQCLDPTCAGFCDDYYTPFDCSCTSSCFDYGTCCDDICDMCADVFVEQCCVPDCTGKQCGGDGCGDSCGSCLAGTKCESGSCAPCLPECVGKVCGDDQCNGSCGECVSGQVCVQDGQCAVQGPCTVFGKLACGQTMSGDTTLLSGFLNDYSCSTWDESGPEATYTFTGDVDQQVTIEFVDGPDVDLDIMILDGVCETASCLQYGNSSIVMDALAGQNYLIVIDGYELAAGPFTLDVKCCSIDCVGKTCDQDNGCGDICGCADPDQECVEGTCMNETCTGSCGDSSSTPFGCYCDSYCFDYGDCCMDICDVCTLDFPDECCTPDCQGKSCGPDGCGGSCGSCDAGTKCDNTAACVPCTPVCVNKECGDDECNGSCGECQPGFACNDLGMCFESLCPTGEIEDCLGDCEDSYYQNWIGDGWCDVIWDCVEYGFDGGDCS